MKRLVCAAGLALALMATSTAVFAQDKIAGRYKGTISSIESNAPGITELSVKNGVIRGAYRFEGVSQTETGKLNNCRLKGLDLYCIWEDAYGTGDWQVRFASDYSRFEGAWYSYVGEIAENGPGDGQLWNGAK